MRYKQQHARRARGLGLVIQVAQVFVIGFGCAFFVRFLGKVGLFTRTFAGALVAFLVAVLAHIGRDLIACHGLIIAWGRARAKKNPGQLAGVLKLRKVNV